MRVKAILFLLWFFYLASGSFAQTFIIKSDNTWKATKTRYPKWTSPFYNDNFWGSSIAPSPNVFPGFVIAPGSQSMWINPYSDTVFFRKSFELRSNCVSATLATISCDNQFLLYVNGNLVRQAANAALNTANIQPFLKIGMNTIAIEAIDWNPPYLVSFYCEISYTSGPVIDIGADKSICQGDSTFFTSNFPYSSYLWSNFQTTRTIKASSTGKYYLEATDSNGCLWADTANLNLWSHKSVKLGNDTIICSRDNVTLNAGTYKHFLWSTGDTSQSIKVNYKGDFSVTVTDNNGCSSSDSKSIEVFGYASINLGNDTILCKGDTMKVNAAFENSTYKWNTGSKEAVITIVEGGVYSVTVSHYCGDVVGEIEVDFIEDVSLELGPDAYFCFNQEFQIIPVTSEVSTYVWSTGDSTQTLSIVDPGVYTLTVYDACGNSAFDQIEVIPEYNRKFAIPNSFSPNRDGINETWKTHLRTFGEFNLRIVDRWNRVLFETNDPDTEWDGTYQGQSLPVGQYAYIAKFIDCESQTEYVSGYINIIW
jgi:gliding motility-associated-like protein